MLTPEELKAIRERCEAARPGPWVTNGYNRIESKPILMAITEEEREALSSSMSDLQFEMEMMAIEERHEPLVARFPVISGDTATQQARKDMLFIYTARTDVPRLLEHIAELTAENQRLKQKIIDGLNDPRNMRR